ncbi:4-alpha-glucanotransferase [Coraliomargarita sp. SDUM461003]|uniref:4-alpha-glucanotransferase n=1 Tax=Thalassobacterium maritimum TaxID=3041265 RepID=A0ABU1AWU5_9BACT|nr:4-alpha-glucanotransferase [Coraliomargarita sp. SDUM461003]MDQ8208616.1 4-alpha-glucanotransferase [Coraliomargarita sp. SDUM461003]
MSTRLFKQDCGLLMHPSSLPNQFGIGDFGPCALRWVEQLAAHGQTLWQILPLNPAGYGDSPYQGLSAFAANPVFLSPEDLHARALLDDQELLALRMPLHSRVDFAQVYANKAELSSRAARKFFALPAAHPLRSEYADFLATQDDWLQDFAIFSALKAHFNRVAWTDWPAEFRDRNPKALQEIAIKLDSELQRVCFEQFILRLQWSRVQQRAQDLGVRLVGDLPIFVAHDSADVWCQPELFRLNADGSPSVVAGVPPDYFSATGQLWGNPLYDWEAHRREDFGWWRQRLSRILSWVDVVRIDHFRGFDACWEVPGGAETAAAGHWIPAPGREVFDAFVTDHGLPLPVIAEDLGVITPEVEKLRDDYNLPGLRIEQFAFGTDPMSSTFLPENYAPNCVAYTGTHDNDTVVGWFSSQAGEGSTRTAKEIEAERAMALGYFASDGSEIHWDFIRSLYRSRAGASIVPVQDILGLGSEARMNTPGKASGSWAWRLTMTKRLDEALQHLETLTRETARGRAAHRGAVPLR